jgi:hypothetical protein
MDCKFSFADQQMNQNLNTYICELIGTPFEGMEILEIKTVKSPSNKEVTYIEFKDNNHNNISIMVEFAARSSLTNKDVSSVKFGTWRFIDNQKNTIPLPTNKGNITGYFPSESSKQPQKYLVFQTVARN